MPTEIDPGAAAPAPVAPSAPAKLSLQDELAAAFAAEPAPAADVTAPVTAEPAAPVVAAEPPKPEPTMARRLAMVARAEKERKEREEAAAKSAPQDAASKALLDRVTQAKSAKSKVEAVKLALDLDDEGVADLFLELHKSYEGQGRPKDPAAELDKLVESKLDARLKARDEENEARNVKNLEDARAAYTADALGVLDSRGDEWPLVAIAPPSQADITGISEAWLSANGEIPAPEEVLKLIQEERQSRFDERRKAAEAKKSKASAPVKTETASAAKTPKPPIAGNDVAIVPPKKMTLQEELLAAFKSSNVSA